MDAPKKRIVILGGGMASLTTAYALTSLPDWQRRYDITVYQMGFRLGGKGASGRNRALANRIEEHGIHVFFGFYDNAFRILKECYEELGRPPGTPLATINDAFKPSSRIAFTEKRRGRWSVWQWDFPQNDAVLGEGGPIPSAWGHVEVLLGRISEWYEEVVADTPEDVKAILAAKTPRLARRKKPALSLERIPALVDRLWQGASPSAFAAVREVIGKLQRSADEVLGEPDRNRRADRAALVHLVRRARIVRESARWLGRSLEKVPSLRRALTLLDFATTTIIGLVEDGIVFAPEDWRKIDDVDLKKWLVHHGAAQETADCALIQGMYAGIFSVGPEVGAGTMLQYTLRMLFTYRGAVFYKMQAGMGDVVFAPLYEVLARRGVKFEFFHRVDRLELDPSHRQIARVVVGRQVEVKEPPYRPLFEVEGVPSWPSEPLYEQLVEGEALRASGESLEDWWTTWPDALPPVVLEAGRDFDLVVLGISLGALPSICRELMADPKNPRFRRMVENLVTTQTQAMQLWFEPDIAGLGWSRGPAIAIPYEEPFDTWTDMAHLIPRESWPAGKVGAIAYLCSPMADQEPVPPPGTAPGYAQRQHRRVKDNARGWLERHAAWLWPKAAAAGGKGFEWSLLVDLEGRRGPARLDAQHFAAPMNPSDRYNLSLPGTSRYRLKATGSGYSNLVLAGDWTFNPINAGCVEAATMSGLSAARAVSGEPRAIPGDWTSALPDLAPSRRREAGAGVLAFEGPSALPIPGPAPAAAALPAYRPLDGNDTPAPPFTARGTRMFVFAVEARMARLQALVDRLLNLGPTRYRPIAPLALFYCQNNAELSSAEPEAQIRELDFGFLIPLLAEEPGRAPRIVVFTPYLWVDTELACRAGREIYGYPKAMGRLAMPSGPAAAGGVFSVDGVIAEPAGGGEEGGEIGRWMTRRLVEARPAAAGAAAPKLGGVTAPLEALVSLFSSVGTGAVWELARNAAGNLARGIVPMVFLKQFRHVEDPSRACYQAIVEASARRIGKLRGGGVLAPGYELAVYDQPGFPIASRLGLTGTRRAGEVVARVGKAVWLEFDFVLDRGRVVWSAAQAPGAATVGQPARRLRLRPAAGKRPA